MSKPVHQLPPVDQMPEKTKLAALREMQMIARYGAARVMLTNRKPVEEKREKTYS